MINIPKIKVGNCGSKRRLFSGEPVRKQKKSTGRSISGKI